jgi:hypothetical protein
VTTVSRVGVTIPTTHRYWDGQDWTPHRQRKPAGRQAHVCVTAPPPAPATPSAPAATTAVGDQDLEFGHKVVKLNGAVSG